MPEPYREPPPAEGDDDGAVEIASHESTVEAEMARGYLQEHGIRAVVSDSASFNPLVRIAAGGARVLVRRSDESRARSLLTRLARTPVNEDDDGDGDGEVRCPRCELTYCFHEIALISTKRAAMPPVFAILLLPLGLSRKRWRCHKCLHVWDDAHEGPTKRTPLHPDDPRPVFRLRRRHGGTGIAVGLVLATLSVLLGTSAELSPTVHLMAHGLTLLLPILGYVVGRSIVRDFCSAPDCHAALPPGAKDCPMCRGVIAGEIRAAHEHYRESAAVRRELAALRAEAPTKKKKAAKKRPKAAPTKEPAKVRVAPREETESVRDAASEEKEPLSESETAGEDGSPSVERVRE